MTMLILWVPLVAQDHTRVLDLTSVQEQARPTIEPYDMQSCRHLGRGAGRSFGLPPVAVAIERFDKFEYSMGGPIVVDLKLTNTSSEPLLIPTVLATQFWEPFEGDEAVQFALSISLKDAKGKDHDLSGTVLRGSAKFPDTTLWLVPGESITVHFPSHILITDGPNPPTTHEGELFASVLVSDGECRIWNPVRSTPVGRVRFTGR